MTYEEWKNMFFVANPSDKYIIETLMEKDDEIEALEMEVARLKAELEQRQ